MAELSLGILIDIVDEDWMRDTLPQDGIFSLSLSLSLPISLMHFVEEKNLHRQCILILQLCQLQIDYSIVIFKKQLQNKATWQNG